MFLWNVQQQSPVLKYQMPNDPTTAEDLPADPDMFVVGDVNGFIHFMSKSSPTPISSINAFGLSVRSAVTTIEIPDNYPLVVAGNQHGYVKYWFLVGSELQEIRRFRAHTEPVRSVSVSPQNRVVVTMGGDERIRQWSVEPFGLIGSYGMGKTWKNNHIDMWESNTPLPDDPMHFIDRTSNDVPGANGEEEEEEDKPEVQVPPIELPAFSLNEIENMMEYAEDICLSGRNQVEKRRSEIMPPEFPLTSRPEPVNTYMYHNEPDFSSIIKKRKIPNTIRTLNNLARGKIFKPALTDRR